MEPWHILAVAAAMSKLESPEYGLNTDGAMQAIRKRLTQLREVMPEANTKRLQQILEKSSDISYDRQVQEEQDFHKQQRLEGKDLAESKRTKHWTAKNAAYFTDHGKVKPANKVM